MQESETIVGFARKSCGGIAWTSHCFVIFAWAAALLISCGKPSSISTDLDPHLVVVTKLYVDHLNRTAGNPPANQQAFEEFIRSAGAERLKSAGTEYIAELFVSTRDKQPLVIFYGNASDPRLQGSVVAHEQTGIDGKRCVGMRYGTVQLVEEGEFRRLVANTP